MPQLSPDGQKAVADIAKRTGFTADAVTSMLFSVLSGRGGMAQFSHPEFGGAGQWMGSGAIMIGDMFNNALKARVDALCSELAALVRREPGLAGAGSFQSQTQGAAPPDPAGNSSLLARADPDTPNWWPSELGAPSSVGAQNHVRYAYFPASRRLVIERGGKVTIYDTRDHQITGVSQQPSGSGSLSFTSQFGAVDIARLPVLSAGAEADRHREERPHSPTHSDTARASTAGHQDILATIERLGDLHAKGILTDAEFSSKKAELLSRL